MPPSVFWILLPRLSDSSPSSDPSSKISELDGGQSACGNEQHRDEDEKGEVVMSEWAGEGVEEWEACKLAE